MVRRGEIYYADLNPVVGSEQGGTRPVLIVQNNAGNKHSPTVIVVAITSKPKKISLPTHIGITARHVGLAKDSVVLTEQIRTIDKKRLCDRITMLGDDDMHRIDKALKISMGIDE